MNPLEWGPWLYGKFFANHHPVWGYLFACSVALFIALMAWTQIRDKYESEHPHPSSPPPLADNRKILDSTDALNRMAEDLKEIRKNTTPKAEGPPFAVNVESTFIAMPDAAASGVWTGFLVGTSGPNGMVCSPAKAALFMRIVNLQSTPTLVYKYAVEISAGKKADGQEAWGKLTRMQVYGNQVFVASSIPNGLKQAVWLDGESMIDNQLVDRTLAPGQQVRGLVLLTYPAEMGFLVAGRLRVTVTDIAGKTFISGPLEAKHDPDFAQARLILPRGIQDISSCQLRQD